MRPFGSSAGDGGGRVTDGLRGWEWRGACYRAVTRAAVTIDEKTLGELHRLASERGISFAALVREALEEKIARSQQPHPRSLGIASSGPTGLGRLSGEIRAEPHSWR